MIVVLFKEDGVFEYCLDQLIVKLTNQQLRLTSFNCNIDYDKQTSTRYMVFTHKQSRQNYSLLESNFFNVVEENCLKAILLTMDMKMFQKIEPYLDFNENCAVVNNNTSEDIIAFCKKLYPHNQKSNVISFKDAQRKLLTH